MSEAGKSEDESEEGKKPTCFVIIPMTTPPDMAKKHEFSGGPDHFEHVLHLLFKPAIEAAGYAMVGPAMMNGTVIHAGIINNLLNAELVLCDMTTSNPSVFLELGVCIALDKPVVLVVDDIKADVPFDIIVLSRHPYDGHLQSWTLKDQIKKLAEVIDEVPKEHNELWQYFGLTREQAGDAPPMVELQEFARMLINALQRQTEILLQDRDGYNSRAPSLTRRPLPPRFSPTPPEGLSKLTQIEYELYVWTASGKSQEYIAEAMNLSSSEVNRYIESAFSKLGIRDTDRARVVAFGKSLNYLMEKYLD